MKIEITGCSRPTYWYADRIGEVFEVFSVDEELLDYCVEDGDVGFEDCIVVDEYCSEYEFKQAVELIQSKLSGASDASLSISSDEVLVSYNGCTYSSDNLQEVLDAIAVLQECQV